MQATSNLASKNKVSAVRGLAASAVFLLMPAVSGAEPHAPTRLDSFKGPNHSALGLGDDGTDFGSALGAGDLNGDGFSDVVVGAQMSYFPGRPTRGAIHIYMGGPAGLGLNPDFVIRGDVSRLGHSVAVANVGGDDHADLIGTADGSLDIWFGGDSFRRQACCSSTDCSSGAICEDSVCRLRSVGSPDVKVRLNPNDPTSTGVFGASLVVVNMAGHSGSLRDLAVGAPGTDNNQGATYVLHGPLAAGTYTLPDDFYSGPRISGWLTRFATLNKPAANRAYYMANGGNLDGGDQNMRQSLFVFGGSDDFYVLDQPAISENRSTLADVTIDAATQSRAHVVGPPAIGFAKNPVYAGHPFALPGGTTGRPGVLSNWDNRLIVMTGEIVGEVLLASDSPSITGVFFAVANPLDSGVLSPADVNGDGMADMALLTPFSGIQLQILSGVSAPRTSQGDMTYTLPPGAPNNFHLAFAGDVDADGMTDVVVGEPSYRNNPNASWGSGRIHLLHDRSCPTCDQKDLRETCWVGQGECRRSGTTNVCTSEGLSTCGNISQSTPFDVTAPTLSAMPASVTLEITNPEGVAYTMPLPTAMDNCAGSMPVISNAPAMFPLGLTSVLYTATDTNGNMATGATAVEVVDMTPPAIDSVAPSYSVITRAMWKEAKKNRKSTHRMVPISITANVSDLGDIAPKCKIEAVTINDGCFLKAPKRPQFEITGDMAVNIKAKRCHKGAERVYTVAVVCTDASGLSTTGSTTVTVPKKGTWKAARNQCAETKQACQKDKNAACQTAEQACGSEYKSCEAGAKTKAERQKCAAAKEQCQAAKKETCQAAQERCVTEHRGCEAAI